MTDEWMERLESDLIRDEGVVLNAYRDSRGFWTIGIGRLIDKRGGGITREEALYLLRNDIAGKVADLDRELPWWRSLPADRQVVLVNMCFNLGIVGLLGFKNTLAAMARGDYAAAASGMRKSKWARQVGARAERLAQIMEGGA